MSGLLDRFIKPIVLAEATQYYNSIANNTNGINEVNQVSVDNSFDNVLSSSVSTQASTWNISPGINEVDQVSVYNSFDNVLFSSVSVETSPARHNLSFRGHREGWEEKNKGHFKDILLLMAPNSYALSSHINSIKSQGKHVCSFISWERQNQLISSISEFIGSTIRSDIKRSRMFSISIDSTFDAARKEQVSFIIRYVSHSSGNIFERLLALKESSVITGESLFDLFELVMDREGLDWKNELVGLSYDGASNMSGEYKGLQARINAKNNSAIFVWCHAHRLNLDVANAVSSNLDAVYLFGNLEFIYSFIWCSMKRAALFREFQDKHYPNMQKKSMKCVATTRWGSHDSALETVLQKCDAILETLEETRRNEGSVSSWSTERSFSKMKLVKTRLRSSTSEDRLEGLVKISSENDIVIDKDLVVDIFAQKKDLNPDRASNI
ncbi:zinc finger MYM-type protein 1-like [Metopolophium dirhodum]|uniref:zinc finger MYM-type protein 1-like n=1 Tax=Metopolophium dirhodum TaxID=44670 RepID=UPI00298F8646|nr:zinc finger MYM-type protein 1-like [Metopolophium dirhodum]